MVLRRDAHSFTLVLISIALAFHRLLAHTSIAPTPVTYCGAMPVRDSFPPWREKLSSLAVHHSFLGLPPAVAASSGELRQSVARAAVRRRASLAVPKSLALKQLHTENLVRPPCIPPFPHSRPQNKRNSHATQRHVREAKYAASQWTLAGSGVDGDSTHGRRRWARRTRSEAGSEQGARKAHEQ
jgi:hypothetical protein